MSNDIKSLENKFTKLIERLKPAVKAALPKHLTADRMCRIALTELRSTPNLLKCTQESVLKCIMLTSQLGLEIGMLGESYLIPYKSECTLQIGYKGMLKLAYRSGLVKAVQARVIYENDEYEIILGIENHILHKPVLSNRGKPIAVYAVADLQDGTKMFEIMAHDQIEAVRTKSAAKHSKPWIDYWEEMAKKTVIRRLFKYLPTSSEMQKAVVIDEHADAGIQSEILDAEYSFAAEEPEQTSSQDELLNELTGAESETKQ